MPTKIRLQRHGKKGYAFFHIVVADGRAPRDGKFIEKIGTYNPNTNPATIELDFNAALSWVRKGAQPTDTTKAILSYKGVLHKYHLEVGVRKGALTEEQAEKKFEAWLNEKSSKIEGKKTRLSSDASQRRAQQLAAEQEANRKKAAAIEAKNKVAAETEVAATQPEEAAQSNNTSEESTPAAE
ncbi:MAG: 30S ribosomal protein S16 [Bacteroidetes bacterium]|nr:30S ribosomal protein S16 [Bacteroidota bacterium]MCL4816409.1 30S ribosomal protein S16 [Flavobacteriales bacterium]NOG95484.1 30S ribosomal protein S16 [Bacteroidota bacterium]WKZ73933.1 MAG: 30S ribosomal protein S16 [Vicingaceae bacterium]CAG0973677.1 30S ribosomal protein S16 [Flavobacteriales bacterium]